MIKKMLSVTAIAVITPITIKMIFDVEVNTIGVVILYLGVMLYLYTHEKKGEHSEQEIIEMVLEKVGLKEEA